MNNTNGIIIIILEVCGEVIVVLCKKQRNSHTQQCVYWERWAVCLLATYAIVHVMSFLETKDPKHDIICRKEWTPYHETGPDDSVAVKKKMRMKMMTMTPLTISRKTETQRQYYQINYIHKYNSIRATAGMILNRVNQRVNRSLF